MPKSISRTICVILIVLTALTTLSACTKRPEPEYAAPIIKGILLAFNDNDYLKYTEHFTEIMKNAAPEAAFHQVNAMIKSKIGNYVSREFWKVENKDQYTIVYYKAKFSQEPKDVIVKVVFEEITGEIYVSGLWFDSPKLRQK